MKIAPAAAGKKVTNAASLESLDQKDDNAANNSSKASLDVLQSVSGSVYRDSDRDGARGGEAGVEGTKVELRDHDGAVVATATTGADSSYSFNRVPSGTATGVKVEDRLPKGLTFVSADRPYDSATGVWDVGTLAPGKSAEISIVARHRKGGLVNEAEIAAADQKDVDSTPGNGVASEDDAASATVTVKPAPKPTPSPSPSPSAEPTSPAPASPEPTSTSPTATPTSPAPSPSPTSSPTATMPTPTPRRLVSSTVPEFSLNAAFAGISSKSSVCGAPRPPFSPLANNLRSILNRTCGPLVFGLPKYHEIHDEVQRVQKTRPSTRGRGRRPGCGARLGRVQCAVFFRFPPSGAHHIHRHEGHG